MVALVFALLGIVLVALSVRTVPQGYTFVVERLGRYYKTLAPSFNLLIPFVDSVRARVSMRETALDIPEQSVITRDNAAISANGVLFFQVLDPVKATYEVVNLPRAIETLAMTTLRNVMGSMELDEILSKRDTINARLLQAADAATASWGARTATARARSSSTIARGRHRRNDAEGRGGLSAAPAVLALMHDHAREDVSLQHHEDADEAGERDRVEEDVAQDRAFMAEPVGRRRGHDDRLGVDHLAHDAAR